jgi:hypothetical protein
MADEVHAQLPTGPNGERMEVRIGNKSLGFTTKDLVTVLLVIGFSALVYLLIQNLSAGQAQGFTGLAQILDKMNAHQLQSFEKMNLHQETLTALVHTNRQQMQEQLSVQNQMLNDQTAEVRKGQVDLGNQLRRMLITMNYNLAHPNDPIPLEFIPEEMPRQKSPQEERR